MLRCTPQAGDRTLLARAEAEEALILTRDHDFLAFQPSVRCGIIYIRIHPSIAEDITQAVRRLLSSTSERALYGDVTILTRSGFDVLPNPL